MYRIRLVSGEEAVYRSADELAQAVASGLLGPDCAVFHNHANRWLPIALHPDYRAIVTGKRQALAPDAVAEPAKPADPALPQPTLDGPDPELSPVAPAIEWVEVEYDPSRDPTPLRSPQRPPSDSGTDTSRTEKLRIMLALAMTVVAVGIMGGGAIATWHYGLPWLERHRAHSGLQEGMPPAPDSRPERSRAQMALAVPRTDSFPTRYPAPAPPLGPVAFPQRSSPADSAGGTNTSRQPTIRNRTPGYLEAYADARAEMDDALDYINFRRVFAPARFASPESLRATRRMVSAAGNILRVYRGREVMMEQSYRPDDPGGRGSFREPFETAEASRSLLADGDSLFGVLVAQVGRFSYDGRTVHFEDPSAAEAYATLRREIVTTMTTWRDSTASQGLVTMPRLLRAFEGAAPPPVRK